MQNSYKQRLELFRTSRRNCSNYINALKSCLKKKSSSSPYCAHLHLEQNLCIGSYLCANEHKDTLEEATPDHQRALATCVQNFYIDIKEDYAAHKESATATTT
jgi:hypothetical protein